MVRVLSVYHFPAQQTKIVEDIVDTCLIPPEKLVIARSGLLEIHSLNISESVSNEPITSFAAIEDVLSVKYSIQGHFLVCLEERGRGSKVRRSVRVYANFEQPQAPSGIKVRIAGKVTPVYSTAETHCLEMLELPLRYPADIIAVCKTTGNVLVAAGNQIHCYMFRYCYSDSTKHRYIDFEEAPFVVELDFAPTCLEVAENIISVMDEGCVHVFQIVGNGAVTWNNSSNDASTSSFMPSDNNHNIENFKRHISLDRDLDYNEIKNRSEVNDQPFIVEIISRNQQISTSLSNRRKTGDLESNEMKPIVISNLNCTLKFDEGAPSSMQNFDLQSLLQLKLGPPLNSEQQCNGFAGYRFLCLVLQPIYLPQGGSEKRSGVKVSTKGLLESSLYDSFVGCSVLVTTQQDGFLYFVYADKSSSPKCFTFPFTSPLIDVALDHTTLHALTENGVETYTIRTGHKLLNDDIPSKVVPSINKSICLIGLRPFLGIRRLLLSNTNLVLLASSLTSPRDPQSPAVWTVYNLQTPTSDLIYRDFEELAKKKYSKNRNAFIDLIEEAHVILRTSLEVARVEGGINDDGEHVAMVKRLQSAEVVEMFKDSCILLGDLHALSTELVEFRQTLPYYLMADLTLVAILKRFKKLLAGAESQASFIYTLKQFLTNASASELETLLATSVKLEDFVAQEGEGKPARFGEVILEMLARMAPSEVALLVLQIPLFMDYIGAGMFETLQSFAEKTPEDVICLVLYLTKRNDVEGAQKLLRDINSEALAKALKSYFPVLFDVSTAASKSARVVNFSEFADTFFLNSSNASHRKLFVDVCLHVVITEPAFIDYDGMLKLYMDHLSALIGDKLYINGQGLVQDFLEKYFYQMNVKRHVVCFKSGDDYTSMDIFSSNSEPTSMNSASLTQDTDNSIRKSVRILIRLYLTHLKYAAKVNLRHVSEAPSGSEAYLKALDAKIGEFFLEYKNGSPTRQKIEEVSARILYADQRLPYLNLMPPFEQNLLTLDATEETSQIKMEQEVYMNLLKLQAILCNSEISSDIYKDVAQFIQANADVVGTEAILSCIYPTNVGMDFVLDKCPQAVLQYSIDRFKSDEDWILLVRGMQTKINGLDEAGNAPGVLLYYRILREILEYIAVSKPLEATMKILSEENFVLHNLESSSSIPNFKYMCDFSDVIHLCNDTKHSTKLKQMIEQTGHQLFEAISKNKIT